VVEYRVIYAIDDDALTVLVVKVAIGRKPIDDASLDSHGASSPVADVCRCTLVQEFAQRCGLVLPAQVAVHQVDASRRARSRISVVAGDVGDAGRSRPLWRVP